MVASFLAALEDRHDILGSFGVLALTQRALGGSTVLLRDGVLFGGLRGLQAHVLLQLCLCDADVVLGDALRLGARGGRRREHWVGGRSLGGSLVALSVAGRIARNALGVAQAGVPAREWLGSVGASAGAAIRRIAASATVCAGLLIVDARRPGRAGGPPCQERVQTDCRRSGRAKRAHRGRRDGRKRAARRERPALVDAPPLSCAPPSDFPAGARVHGAILVVQERARRRLGRLLPPRP